MTDILCPTCGRPNPDQQDLCEFCGSPLGLEEISRLDDLVSPQEPEDESSRLDDLIPPDDVQQPSTDEFTRLDSYLAEEETKAQVPDEPFSLDDSSPEERESDVDSFLDSLRSAEKPPDEPTPLEDPILADDRADEISRLDDIFSDLEDPQQPSEFDELFSAEADSEEPSAVDEISSDLKEPKQPSDFDEFFSALEESEDPSRLSGILSDPEETEQLEEFSEILTPEEEPESPSSLEEIIPDAEQPDETSLLDDIASQEKEPTHPSLRDKFLPSDDGIKEPEEPIQSTESDQVAEIPEAESADSVLFDEDLSDKEIPPVPVPEGTEGDQTPDDDFSASPPGDWFSAEESQTDESESPTEPLDDLDPGPMSPGFGEDPGWLDMLQEPTTTDTEPIDGPALPTPPPPVKKKDTDWLERIKRLNKSADVVDDDSSFPDWLTVSEKAAAKKEEEEPPPTVPPAAEEVPDWLQLDDDDEQLGEFLRKKDLTDEEYHPESPVEEAGEKAPEQKPAPDITSPKRFPSWASDEDGAVLGDEGEIPEELRFLAGLDPSSTGAKTVIPFQAEEDFFDDLYSDELPNWLESATDDGTSFIEDAELAVGELPGWVEAMRPVVESSDATGLGDDEDYIENFGPLAGIPSVLPAEADIVIDPEKVARKPLDLTASKSHQSYVSVLRKLIERESKTPEIIKTAPIQTQRILRWLIAIVLLVTIAGTIIFGGSFRAEVPVDGQLPNTGYAALYNQISELDSGQPVLIAFDYQPAAAGELHTAAASVVDHLMEQGTYLSFISTHPTGPALAEHFLITTQEKHQYRHNQHYVNLGYLPGESAGLVSFLIAPKQIIPLAFNGSNAWGSPPLLSVNAIEDFDMILVITDDPNTAKIWVEQVGPNLYPTPLTMVVSAQVEPIIQPYFRNYPQLISGYVAGVIGSMNYEGLLQEPNLATATWLPFNIGIIITVGTIFIGGLANGILSLFSKHRTKKLGEIK